MITEIQILGLLICAVLSAIAYKTKQPPIALISSVGIFIIGFQIYSDSEDLLILGLCFVLAFVQFMICFPSRRG